MSLIRSMIAGLLLFASALFAFDHGDSLGEGWTWKRALVAISFAVMALVILKEEKP